MRDDDEHADVLTKRFTARHGSFGDVTPETPRQHAGETDASKALDAQAPPTYGNVDRGARKRLEHDAVATPAQRAVIKTRRSKPKADKLVNFKTTTEAFGRLEAVAAHAGSSMTKFILRGIELAIAEYLARIGKTEAEVLEAGRAATAKRAAIKKGDVDESGH